MARMIPDLDGSALEKVQSAAEREVYAALRTGLPDDVLVVHSLALVVQRPGQSASDAETDFLIISPNYGILTVEVKGGGVAFDASAGQWWSTDRAGSRHAISDPFRQARQGKHEVLRLLRSAPEWGPQGAPWVLSAHAVLFPDLADIHALAAPERPEQIMGGRQALRGLRIWVEHVFQFWAGQDTRWRGLGADGVRIIEKVLCKNVSATPPLAFAVASDQQRQIELTNRQARILRALRIRTRAAIAGGAGTGKTVLALQHASDLASQGLETLLVCFNRLLADTLAARAAGKPKLHAMSFHQLCSRRIEHVQRLHGINLMAEAEHAYAGDDKYTVQLPYALALSAEHDVFRFDAIVVDEAQDFPDEFWLPLELLLTSRTEARLFVFFDTNQSVYRMSSSLPISEPPLLLTENCRNTRPIHEAAYQFYSGEEVDPPEIQGAPQQVLTGNGVEEQARLLGKLVIQLTHGDALNPQDIAVLIVGEPKELYYEALRCLPLPHGLKWGIEQGFAEKTIVVDTVKRFKGLEAPVVILWGVDAVDPLRHRELLYVALSRARSRLFVVSDGQRLAAILSKGHPDSREIQRYRT